MRDGGNAVFSFLCRSADLCRRHLDHPDPGRRHLLSRAADQRISRDRPADDRRERHLCGRVRRGHRRNRRGADRAGDQRRRQYALRGVAIDRQRRGRDQRRLQAGNEHRPGAGAGAESGLDRLAAIAGRGAARRRDRAQELARPDAGDPSDLARRDLGSAIHFQLRHDQHQGCHHPHRRRGRYDRLRRARLFHAGLARSRQGAVPRPHRQRRGGRLARRQRAGGGRRHQPAAGDVAGRVRNRGADARPAVEPRSIQRDRCRHRSGRPRDARARHRPGRARLAGLHDQRLSRQPGGDRHRHFPAAGLERARDRGRRARDDGRARQELPRRGSVIASPTTPPSSFSNRSTR